MAIKDCKITDAGMNANGIVAAPDKLEGSASENKVLFDRLVRQVVALQFNTLLDELLAPTAAGELGMEAVDGLDAKTVQEGFRKAAEALTQRICKVKGSVKGRLPVLQEDGTLQDGGVLLEDVLLRLVAAKAGNIPAFDSTGKLKDSGVSVADMQEMERAAEKSADAAARSAEVAREIATGDVVSQTELQETVETLARKDTFIVTYGGDDVVSYKKVDLKLFQDVVDAYTAGRPIILHRWANGKLHQSSLSMTDYTDSVDVLIFREPMESGNSTNCRFIRNNEEGYVQWTRESKYPTPAEHTHTPASIGAAVTKNYTATLPYSSWTTSGNYVYKAVTVSGILSSDNPIVDIKTGTDNAANLQYQTEFGKVFRIVAAANKLTFYATAAPTMNIPIQVKVVR